MRRKQAPNRTTLRYCRLDEASASGDGVGAISEASRRFAKELETDGELREVVARIKGRLIMCGM